MHIHIYIYVNILSREYIRLVFETGRESVRKIIIDEQRESATIAVVSRGEAEENNQPGRTRFSLFFGKIEETLWTPVIGLLAPRRCKIVS